MLRLDYKFKDNKFKFTFNIYADFWGIWIAFILFCGVGEMLPFLEKVLLGHGPNKNLGAALEVFAANVSRQNSGEDLYIKPNWPRFIWKHQANRMYWIPRAKKNGLKKKDIFRK